MKNKFQKKCQRHKKIRAVISGTSNTPRLCVFRSNKHIYAQLIDDKKGTTILAVNDLELKNKKKKDNKKNIASEVGEAIANKAKEKGIKKVVFDRGGYRYHGRVKALAEGARKGGLEF